MLKLFIGKFLFVRCLSVKNKYILPCAGYLATKLLCRLICNLPELSIRIFQSAYFLFFD